MGASGSGLSLPNANALKIGSTSYIGDGSDGRLVPHGSPSKPVQIVTQSEDVFSLWMDAVPIRPLVLRKDGTTVQEGIVAVDSTNIQVSVGYDALNYSGDTYYVTYWYY